MQFLASESSVFSWRHYDVAAVGVGLSHKLRESQCCCKVAGFAMARRAAKVVQRCSKLVVQLRFSRTLCEIADRNAVSRQ